MDLNKVPWYYMLLLIFSGESIFILPFVLPRLFRPTVLEVFSLDNVQLGFCFSLYGIVALLSYLLGGPLADKYPPRKLIALALWMTALGGFVFASFPSYDTLRLLYGYWGFTTIFLFWPSLIKATRIWGGTKAQGKAFGFLDGGRGLVGALFGTIGVVVFSLFLTAEIGEATIEESRQAFRYVILLSTAIILLVGILIWFFLTTDSRSEVDISIEKITISQIRDVLRLKSVWLLMVIILCAYVGYKITDVLSLYAQDVMLYDQVKSAKIATFLFYIRPAIGVLIGILADRTAISLWLVMSFIFSFFGALLFATGIISASTPFLFLVSIFIVASGVYASRSLYFAVMENGKIPLILTGTAVGLISLVGYTPDIFAGPIIGYLLDSSPGAEGHQHVFWMLSVFSLVGGLASVYYYVSYKKD